MRDILRSITQSIRLPSICVLCKHYHKDSTAVCTHCIALLPRLGPACVHCAYPLFDGDYLLCGQCIANPPPIDKALISYRFEEPLRTLIHQFKYHHRFYLCTFLSQLIMNAWQQEQTQPQCLIPVPMHPKKIRQRGFNQSILLTRLLAKKTGIPYDLTLCRKSKNTEAQATLNGKQRIRNVQGAFSLNTTSYEHIALIDDLLTTGSTANELARTFKKAGVKKVELWCCARTVTK